MMKMLESYNHKLGTTESNHEAESNQEAKFNELKDLISGIAYQQTSLLRSLKLSTGEANTYPRQTNNS
jgi:hypothetical protein